MNHSGLLNVGRYILIIGLSLCASANAIAGSVLVTLKKSTVNDLKALGMTASESRPQEEVVVSMKNEGKTGVLILSWDTALKGVTDDIFIVQRDGEAVRYIGPHYKRAAPRSEDYIEIKAGEEKSAIVDVSAFYDMTKSGAYTIQFSSTSKESFDVISGKAGESEKIISSGETSYTSDKLNMWVSGIEDKNLLTQLSSTTTSPYAVIGSGKASFVGCSNTRVTQINQGLEASEQMASTAKGHLEKNNVNGSRQNRRYTEWFGQIGNRRYKSVRLNFGKIDEAIKSKPVSFYCDCDGTSAYAFVYPNRPYEIHLCDAFWRAPVVGTDSKGGTIIHELSHFTIVADTDDNVYGQAGARNLARTNPTAATQNADSHEYFAENTPPL